VLLEGTVSLPLRFQLFLGHWTPESDQVSGEEVWSEPGKAGVQLMQVLDEGLHGGRRNAEWRGSAENGCKRKKLGCFKAKQNIFVAMKWFYTF
jgi:hypothetical protein